MHYCLIEKWRDNFSLPVGSKAVALNEEVIYHLELGSHEYTTLENFYKSYEIRGDVDTFTMEQLTWFDEFDTFLKKAFHKAAELNVNLATIYYFGIKYTLDNVILSSLVLRQFIKTANPTMVTYVGLHKPPITVSSDNRHPYDNMLDRNFSFGESLFSRLLEPLCDKFGIEFHRLEPESTVPIDLQTSPQNRWKKEIFRRFVKSLRIYFDFSNLTNSLGSLVYICRNSKQRKTPKGKILVLHSLRSTSSLLIDLRNHGFELWFRQKLGVRHVSWNRWHKLVHIPTTSNLNRFEDDSILTALMTSSLMETINNHCGLDVSDILYSRFRYFLFTICPDLLKRIEIYLEYFTSYKIDYVLTATIWSVDQHAALAAARLSPSTKTIGMSHGSDAYNSKSRYLYLHRYYDFFISPTNAETNNARLLTKSFNLSNTQCYTNPYIHQLKQRKRKKKKKIVSKVLRSAGKREIVLFAPIIYPPPNSPANAKTFQLIQPFAMEYVRWHQALAEYFSKKTDKYFVWKTYRFDSVAKVLGLHNYKNIRFVDGDLYGWYPYVDRVLCDVPSSAFFKAVFENTPAMALYRQKYQLLNNDTRDYLGSSLTSYASIDEGLEAIENYLSCPKAGYIVPTLQSGDCLPKILIQS